MGSGRNDSGMGYGCAGTDHGLSCRGAVETVELGSLREEFKGSQERTEEGQGALSAGTTIGRRRQSVLSSWLKIQRDEKMFLACEDRVGAKRGEDERAKRCVNGGQERRKGRMRASRSAGTDRGVGENRMDVDITLGNEVAMCASFGGGDMGAVGWDVTRRRQLYEHLVTLAKLPQLPELTVEEANCFVLKWREEGIGMGGFFPPDIVVAARSLKLTRRLFHVDDSTICQGRGLWLNKGMKLRKGEFVGLYIGWVYSNYSAESVWDSKYRDNTYSLGLTGWHDKVTGQEDVRVNARDDMFEKQENVFTLGYANEWIWESLGGRRGGGNILRFGNNGMVYVQKSVVCSKSRVEVTIGFGKEGVPFGGWTDYTIQLAARLCDVACLLWTQVQHGLPDETRQGIATALNGLGDQLGIVTYASLPSIRESRTLLAILISGVELQDADEEWGRLGYEVNMSLADNLRGLALHPAVRRRCAFRQADAPGVASSRGTGELSFWEGLLRKEQQFGKGGGGIECRGTRMSTEGMERRDGRWEWCVPVPLRKEWGVRKKDEDTRGGLAQADIPGRKDNGQGALDPVCIIQATCGDAGLGEGHELMDGGVRGITGAMGSCNSALEDVAQGDGGWRSIETMHAHVSDWSEGYAPDEEAECGGMGGNGRKGNGSSRCSGGRRGCSSESSRSGGGSSSGSSSSCRRSSSSSSGSSSSSSSSSSCSSSGDGSSAACSGVSSRTIGQFSSIGGGQDVCVMRDKDGALLKGDILGEAESAIPMRVSADATLDIVRCEGVGIGEVKGTQIWPVGSRWIFDGEECEVVREAGDQGVEVIFSNKRLEIVKGPFVTPDFDDFVGWPEKARQPVCVSAASCGASVGSAVVPYSDDLEIMGFSGGVLDLLKELGSSIPASGSKRMRIATWNASGLTKLSKVRYMMALMVLANVDIFCVQDTRLEPGQWKDVVEKEIRQLLGPGGSVFVATVSPRIQGSKGPNVGGQILIKCPRLRSSCRFQADTSTLGLVCTLDLQVGAHDVRVVSVYVPPVAGERIDVPAEQQPHVVERAGDMEFTGALACRVQQYIRASGRWDGCIDYILGTAQQRIDQHRSAPGGVVFCVGDFNASGSTEDKRSVNGSITDWVESVGLHHSVTDRGLQCPQTFFRNSEGVSAIDHIMYSKDHGVASVDHWTLSDSMWLSLSDHCPLAVEFEMPGLGDVYVSRRQRIKAQRRVRLDICRFRGSKDGEEAQRDVSEYRTYLDRRLQAQVLQGSLDEQLEEVLRVSKAALRSVQRRRRKRDWWSPIMVAITANLVAVCEMERYYHGRGRPRWGTAEDWRVGVQRIVQNWRSQIGKMGVFRGEGSLVDLLEVTGTGPQYWASLEDDFLTRGDILKTEVRRLRLLIRSQERKEATQFRQDRTQRRLWARQKGIHLRELRDMMSGGSTHFSMDYIVDEGLYVVDDRQVHAAVSAHFRKWFERKERDWGFVSRDCDTNRLWNDRDFFMMHHSASGIPAHLLETVWTAMRCKTVDQDRQKLFEHAILAAPTLEEFERELADTSTHSASGPTGITYNAIAGWPRDVLVKVHTVLTEFWENKSVPRCWKWRWLVPIPKTTENVTLNDLRPLMLTDTVRKVWVGVLVRKIQSHLIQEGLLSTSQHGTLANRSTEGALVQFRNILEEARESCTDAYLSSWDVVKAFDKLQKNVQVMCWVRLGIPAQVAEYLVSMDDLGTTMVRTPFAEKVWDKEGAAGFSTAGDKGKAEAFSPLSGTGQGNIDSPLVWTAFMDILLCALETVQEDQFFIRTNDSQGEGLEIVREIAYVDDLVSLTSRVSGLQRKADIVCAFFIIFGMDSARIKFRTFQVEWGSEYTSVGTHGRLCKDDGGGKFIMVHKEGWKARKVWLQTYRTAPPFKYLGVLFDLSNLDLASFSKMLSVARRGIARVCQSLGDAELRVEALLYCVYPQMVYSAKFASWPLRRYLELDKIFSGAYRRILGLRKTFPEELLYAPWGVRGIGISRFSDEVHMAKIAIINRGATADPRTREATMSLVLRGLRQQNKKPLYTQAATLGTGYMSSQPLFIRSLTEWLEVGEIYLRKGGVQVKDVSYSYLKEYCESDGMAFSAAELSLLEAYGISTIGDVVMCSELQADEHLRRGRSRKRAVDTMHRRGMEGIEVETAEEEKYVILRYVHPCFIVRRSGGNVESVSADTVLHQMSLMANPPTGLKVRWVVLPSCLHFLYSRLPPRPPDLSSILLARDQCWASTEGRYSIHHGWVWEILGFSSQSICVRLWRVDDGVTKREVRIGAAVRLITPSHGAGTTMWVPRMELLCGEGWSTPGEMFRILLGPDVSKCGIVRNIVAMFTQPRVVMFKSEMELPLLAAIHEYATAFQDCNVFTDGSVVQEVNPIVNSFIPSPATSRRLGLAPRAAGSLIARPDDPAAHGMNMAIRVENGHEVGCRHSFDIEMMMLTLACLIRDQLQAEVSPQYVIWSDCKSAVDKASLVDMSQIRRGGHKEHGLLLRRMYYSKHTDASMLQHVKGHPERTLPNRFRWQELRGKEAGIFLADKIANVRMSADERYLWENDGSIRSPLMVVEAADLLRLFADIDLWSIVDKKGIPIIDSPLERIQAARFARYLKRRDSAREDKLWTEYVITAPRLSFTNEKLYHRRAKVTKVLFNWYLRAEQVIRHEGSGGGGGVRTEDQGGSEEVSAPHTTPSFVCQMCGKDMEGDTERHLYVLCEQVDIASRRREAELGVELCVNDTPDGPVNLVMCRLRDLLLLGNSRHQVWKGIISSSQIAGLYDGIEGVDIMDLAMSSKLTRKIKECLGLVGAALMDIRRLAWKAGTPMGPRQCRAELGKAQVRELSVGATASITTSLGILSPIAAVRWEMDRRRMRKATALKHKKRVSQLPKVFVGEGKAPAKGRLSKLAGVGKRDVRKRDTPRQKWDVH